MFKAYQFRSYPDKEQAALLARTFGCARKACSLMREGRIKRYEETKEMLRATPAMHKEQYPDLKEVDGLAPANAQLNLDDPYKSFFQGPEVGFPNFKRKHRGRNSYTTNV
ncbi:MAG: helix-turn-helix domain-containing protein [Clostridiales bacterium]|nr:helix-turn-helix domain-containing protein [Clostridiales bacterium]